MLIALPLFFPLSIQITWHVISLLLVPFAKIARCVCGPKTFEGLYNVWMRHIAVALAFAVPVAVVAVVCTLEVLFLWLYNVTPCFCSVPCLNLPYMACQSLDPLGS